MYKGVKKILYNINIQCESIIEPYPRQEVLSNAFFRMECEWLCESMYKYTNKHEELLNYYNNNPNDEYKKLIIEYNKHFDSLINKIDGMTFKDSEEEDMVIFIRFLLLKIQLRFNEYLYF